MNNTELAENWNTIIVCVAFNGAIVIDISPRKFNILFWDKSNKIDDGFCTFEVNKKQLKQIYKEARELRIEADYMRSDKEKEVAIENEKEIHLKKKFPSKRSALEKKEDVSLKQEDIEFPEDGPEQEPYDQI